MPTKSRISKKSRKTAQPAKNGTNRVAANPNAKTEVEIAELSAPVHVQRFVADVMTRGEAAPLKNGKLPLGKTHVIQQKKGSPPKLVRARYSLTGA